MTEASPGLWAWRMGGVAIALLGIVAEAAAIFAPKANHQAADMLRTAGAVLFVGALWLSAGAWIAPRKPGWWIMAAFFLASLIPLAITPRAILTALGVVQILFCIPALVWSVRNASVASASSR